MALNYDIKKIFAQTVNPMLGERVLFLNDRPLDEGKVTADHKSRDEMIRIWKGAMEELAAERKFTVEPILYYEVTAKDPSGWQGKGTQDGKPVDLSAKLDTLGPNDIVVAVTGESITFELMRRQPAQQFRVASAPGVFIDQKGFEADFTRIPLRFKAMVERIQAADTAEVTFRGPDLEKDYTLHIDLRGVRYKYFENAHCHEPGRLINLPSGCANCIPYRGEEGDDRGTSTTHGEAPVLRGGKFALFTFKDGAVTDITGDADLVDEFRSVVFDEKAPDMKFLGKLGIGLNEKCEFKEPHVEKEKAIGIHWGVGNAKKFFTVYAKENPIHVDITFVYGNGERETVMRDSAFDAAHLGPVFENV
ncbi:MAG: M29 family metallopeptidase [Planctomycetota bacterium]